MKWVFFSRLSFSPTGSGLNDGQWHSIRFVAKENFAMLTVDGEEASAVQSTAALVINTGRTYHLGGEGQHSAVDATHLSYFYAFDVLARMGVRVKISTPRFKKIYAGLFI